MKFALTRALGGCLVGDVGCDAVCMTKHELRSERLLFERLTTQSPLTKALRPYRRVSKAVVFDIPTQETHKARPSFEESRAGNTKSMLATAALLQNLSQALFAPAEKALLIKQPMMQNL